MRTRIVEVTNGVANWGKFLVGEFDEEWNRQTALPLDPELKFDMPLLRQLGHSHQSHLIFDLQTCEGVALPLPHKSSDAHCDLDKHRVWVCPMFEPFLAWLYVNFTTLDALPEHLDLPDAEFSMSGYRRSGVKS